MGNLALFIGQRQVEEQFPHVKKLKKGAEGGEHFLCILRALQAPAAGSFLRNGYGSSQIHFGQTLSRMPELSKRTNLFNVHD